MRGFVVTILSMSLIMALFVLAASLHNSHLSTERALMEPLPLIYAASLLDDVAYELNSITGPVMAIEASNESTVLAITDSLHSHNHSGELSAYKAFMEGEVASSTASTINVNLTNISDGRIRVFINEDYVYTNDHGSQESVFTREGSTNASSYEIDLTIVAVRTNITHMEFNESGTLNVTIRYIDLNGTGSEQGRVFPDRPNSMTLYYEGESSMTVSIGPESGNDASLRMKADGVAAETAWTAILPPSDADTRMGYEYDAIFSYVQGRAAKSCRIGK